MASSRWWGSLLLSSVAVLGACADDDAGRESRILESQVRAEPYVRFLQPLDGEQIVGEPVDGRVRIEVVMEVVGYALRPATQLEEGTGHHHILVDTASVPEGEPIKTDAQHLHFGMTQTEAELWLEPGEHTLILQFADGAHVSYGPRLSERIVIEVVADRDAW
jgi:hypothetical protein